MSGQADVMDWLAGQVRQALEAADLDAYAGLLDPAVRCGPPGDPSPLLQNRAQVLAWYSHGRDSGARGRVIETLVAGDKILVGLKVTGIPASALAGGKTGRWQVFTVRGGRITAITGFAERDEAAAWAGPPSPGPFLFGHRGRLPRHRADNSLRLVAKEAIHHPGAGSDHRAQLVPVHGLVGADI